MGGPLEGKRILVVEDDYLLAEAVCEVLRDAGAMPIGPVGNAALAIKVASTEALDGVLLDVKLQETNGSRVAAYLRSKKVPFLLLTGYSNEALDAGLRAAPHLAKPAAPGDLVEAAVAVFGGHGDEK
jgi:CheY-like chemotaxis protein